MRRSLLTVILVGLGLTFCETGIEINLTCLVKHTAERVLARSQILGEKKWAMVNITWTWTVKKPDGDSCIVERSLSGEEDYTFLGSTGVDTLMSFTDKDSILTTKTWFTYRLSLVDADRVDHFKNLDVDLPSYLYITSPSTDSLSIPNDTLQIVWHKLKGGGDEYNPAIFKSNATEIESLINLVSPIDSTTTTDTTFLLVMPDSLYPPLNTYIIKVVNSELVEYVTDTSIGFRAFFRLP
ncbi:MAG TPA: hypothetical protein EYP24_00130 [bacterium (Candidatus Stahlbacteria)]|nr:hypothetical protein [Candidatus Stahlbacteria bacterium]